MVDLLTLCAVSVAGASILTIPVQMIRHLRMDLEGKLEYGEKRFDTIVEQLEKCSDNMAKCHADYAAVNAKLCMLIEKEK